MLGGLDPAIQLYYTNDHSHNPCGCLGSRAEKAGHGPMAVSLARRSLIHEWRRYLAAVLAVSFSGLLVIVQVGLLLGLFRTVTAVVDNAGADLWIVEPTVHSFDLPRDMPERVEFHVLSHPTVLRVERMLLGFGDWRTPQGAKVMVTIVGINVGEGSLGFPRIIGADLRRALRSPGAVLVDRADLNKLGLGESLAGPAEIDGRRVEVVGITSGFRSVGGALVFVSEATFRRLQRESIVANAEGASFLLVALAPGATPRPAAAELEAAAGGEFRAMTPGQLSVMSQRYWLLESGTGVGFLFSTALGLVVGVAIASQSLRAAMLASVREFATLRALGVPLAALRRVVIEQSFWIGAAGLASTIVLTGVVWAAASAGDVAMNLTWWAMFCTGVLTLGVSFVSGLLSLGPILRTEPADLLR